MRYVSLRRNDISPNNCATTFNDDNIGIKSYRISTEGPLRRPATGVKKNENTGKGKKKENRLMRH